jgi:hypothetical protein
MVIVGFAFACYMIYAMLWHFTKRALDTAQHMVGNRPPRCQAARELHATRGRRAGRAPPPPQVENVAQRSEGQALAAEEQESLV